MVGEDYWSGNFVFYLIKYLKIMGIMIVLFLSFEYLDYY